MDLIYWILLPAAIGPALGVLTVVADSRWGGRALSRRRLIIAPAIGGMITVGALGVVLAIVPEGILALVPLLTAAGGVLGGMVGLLAALLWRRRLPRRLIRSMSRYPRDLSAEDIPPELSSLVRDLADRMLTAPAPEYEILRRQLADARLTRITLTGAGLFAYFDHSPGTERVSPPDMFGGEVPMVVESLDAPAGSLLKVSAGRLDFVEIYTFGEVPWPDMPRILEFGEAIPVPIPLKASKSLARNMLSADLLGEPEIWARMSPRFPWVEEERGEIGEGLIHLDFAALRHGVERAADANDIGAAGDVLAFIEELVDKLDALHPDVVNALDVSFLEDLFLAEQRQRAFVAPLLLPKTKARWDEIAAAYEGRSD